MTPLLLRGPTTRLARVIVPRSTFIGQAYLRVMSSKTLTEAIKEDHEEMYEFFDQYKQAREKGDVGAQERWTNQLRWEIARHAVGEEIVVYPLMETHLLEKGEELANHDRSEHLKIKDGLYKLEGMNPGSQEFHDQLSKTMEILHKHNDDEEVDDLPLLEPKIGEDASRSYAQSFKRTKFFAPTRAHPSAPNKPPFETVVALMAAPIDNLKDVFAKFPSGAEMEQAEKALNSKEWHNAAAERAVGAR